MPILHRALVKRAGSALFALVSWLCFTLVASGSEKIRVREGTEKIDLPNKILKDDFFSKPLDFSNFKSGEGRGSLIPNLPAPNQSIGARKDQLEKKHWLENAPETPDPDAELKKIFGVRDYNLESLEKRSKGSSEDLWGGSAARKGQALSGRYYEDRLSRRETDRSRKELATDPISRFKERDQLGRSDSPSDDESSLGNTSVGELNLNNFFHPSQSTDPLSGVSAGVIGTRAGPNGLGRLFDQNVAGQPARSREQELRTKEFEKLIKGPPSLAKPANDPINSLPDGTRLEINPIKGRRLDVYSGEAGSAINSDSLSVLGKTMRPGLLDSLNTKVLGASSLAPSVVAPPLSPILDAKPPVLEIPRRKF